MTAARTGGAARARVAATRPATTEVRRSDLTEWVVAYRRSVRVGALVVRDIVFSSGSVAPAAPLTLPRTGAPESKPGAETKGQQSVMSVTYTFDVFSILDGYGAHRGNWGG